MKEMRFDRVDLKAMHNDHGFIHDSPILTRTGVFEYRDAQGKVRREYRPPHVVFHKDSLDAYRGIPITDGHLGKMTSKNVKGVTVGSVLSVGRQDGDNLLADVVIHDTGPVEAGKKELSVGYEVEFDETPGVSPQNERYDAVQIAIRPNHLAIVKKGRAGTARLNLDAADAEDEPTKEETAMTMVKVKTASGMSYDAAPEIDHEVNSLRTQLTEATGKLDKETARADSAEAKIKTHEADLAKIRQDAVETVQGRLKLEATATDLGVEFKADSTDRQIKEAVVLKVRGADFKMDGKSDDYVTAVFDLAAAEKRQSNTNVASARTAMGTPPAGKVNQDAADTAPSQSAASARERFKQGQRK